MLPADTTLELVPSGPESPRPNHSDHFPVRDRQQLDQRHQQLQALHGNHQERPDQHGSSGSSSSGGSEHQADRYAAINEECANNLLHDGDGDLDDDIEVKIRPLINT